MHYGSCEKEDSSEEEASREEEDGEEEHQPSQAQVAG
jgi:hypothetical protein